MNDPRQWKIGLLGYGEVGRILAEDLRAQGVAVGMYDRKLDKTDTGEPLRQHANTKGVKVFASAAALAEASELVISAVTAAQTVDAASACAPGLRRDAWFLDFNSASPAAKQLASARVEEVGGRYVEAAVMTSVPPYRIRVPMLLGGPHADTLLPSLAAFGFAAKASSDRLGVVSATKMCRSVMIKGLEAMVIESLTAARHYGVDEAVLASLRETFPGIDWEAQATYFFQRVIEHGHRRSEEMRESAATVRDAGLDAWSASGTAERQAWIAALADDGVFGVRDTPGFARSTDWRTEADRLLAHLKHQNT